LTFEKVDKILSGRKRIGKEAIMKRSCSNCRRWGTVFCPIRYNGSTSEEDWKKLNLKPSQKNDCHLWKNDELKPSTESNLTETNDKEHF